MNTIEMKKDKFGSLTDKQVKDYIKKHGTNVFTTLLNEPQRTQVSFATGLYNTINNWSNYRNF